LSDRCPSSTHGLPVACAAGHLPCRPCALTGGGPLAAAVQLTAAAGRSGADGRSARADRARRPSLRIRVNISTRRRPRPSCAAPLLSARRPGPPCAGAGDRSPPGPGRRGAGPRRAGTVAAAAARVRRSSGWASGGADLAAGRSEQRAMWLECRGYPPAGAAPCIRVDTACAAKRPAKLSGSYPHVLAATVGGREGAREGGVREGWRISARRRVRVAAAAPLSACDWSPALGDALKYGCRAGVYTHRDPLLTRTRTRTRTHARTHTHCWCLRARERPFPGVRACVCMHAYYMVCDIGTFTTDGQRRKTTYL
jgi:hypothetical protein